MKTTDNYNMNLPEPTDAADIADINSNTTVIDETLKQLQDQATALQEKITNIAEIQKAITTSGPNASVAGQLKVSGDIVPGKITSIANLVYPVGSIYMSINSASPEILFGGTWERIQDTFLLAAGNSYSAGTTGGEATHTLTQTEMPSHTHTQEAHAHRLHIWFDAAATGSKVNTPASTSPLSKASFTDSLAPKINSTGGGQAHNNMPPYLAVYVWKRTA